MAGRQLITGLGEATHLLGIMGDQQTTAAGGQSFPDHRLDDRLAACIQPAGRLIQQQGSRAALEKPGETETLYGLARSRPIQEMLGDGIAPPAGLGRELTDARAIRSLKSTRGPSRPDESFLRRHPNH
jgi:hypothetical protein